VVSGTRDLLIDAAVCLLDEGGVDGVTLREVGRMAGVSHNAPYKHFASKQALLAAIAARDLARESAAITAQITPATPPAEALRLVLRRYADWALEYPARFKLAFGAWQAVYPELDQAARGAQAMLTGVVFAAQETGALPAGDPERLAALLRALAHGAADLASAGHLAPDGKGHAGPGDLIDDMLRYLYQGAAAARGRVLPTV
jgi:AcrR family transcriptional regulator